MNKFLLIIVASILYSVPLWALDITDNILDDDENHVGVSDDYGNAGNRDRAEHGRGHRHRHHPRPTPTPEPTPVGSGEIKLLKAFEAIGGADNNQQHPEFDAVPGMPMICLVPPSGEMGTGPNPRAISNTLGTGKSANGTDYDTPSANASAWGYVMGQFVDHDLGLSEVPATNASIPITVAPGDPALPGGGTIPMTRVTTDPGTLCPVNASAGYLDLSQVYGSNQATADNLRGPNGTLKFSANSLNSSDTEEYLPLDENGNFMAGDPRATENFELTAVQTLFAREHNRLAAMLAKQHPHWTSDELYLMARQINIAEYQNIVYTEFLPVLIGSDAIPAYRGYNPNVKTQESIEFAGAAYRVGHSMISNCQSGLDNNGNETFNISLAQSFHNTTQQDLSLGFDELIRGITADVSQHTDVYLVPGLRNHLFAPLPDTSDIDVIDLGAIDVQRARDIGIATLNQTRIALGLPAYTAFNQISSDSAIQTKLKTAYGDVDAVELFYGGLAEDLVPDTNVGPTFQAIIADQFTRLRDGDRWYWKNVPFDSNTKAMIAGTTLTRIIMNNTNTTMTLPANVFLQSGELSSSVSPKFLQQHPRFVPGPPNNN